MKINLFVSLAFCTYSILSISQVSFDFECQAHRFWTINSNGHISEYTIESGIVEFVNTYTSVDDGASIAFCTGSPGDGTIHVAIPDGVSTEINYWNGTAWVSSNDNLSIYNIGGNGDHRYGWFGTLGASVKYSFQNGDFNVITTISDYPAVADCPVDAMGRLWLFTGPALGITTNLLVINPDGSVAVSYSITEDTLHAYGAAFIDGTLYVGLGSSNTSNPSKLMPVVIDGATASFGTGIDFPGAFFDLAGCSAGPTSIKPIKEDVSPLVAYPNPSNGDLTLNVSDQEHVTLIDKLGAVVWDGLGSELESLKSVVPGTYIVLAELDGYLRRTRIVITR